MPKFIIMYDLKDDKKEEDFVKWVNEYKGPFVLGLNGVKSYTITSVLGAVKSEGGPPAPAEPPYNIAAIVDVTSFEDYAKAQESDAYKNEFMPAFMQWVKGVMIMRVNELFQGAN